MRNYWVALLCALSGCTTASKNVQVVSLPASDERQIASSTALKEIGFEKMYWRATNCHLNEHDFVVLQLLQERWEKENPFQLLGQPVPDPSPAPSAEEKTPLQLELEDSTAKATSDLTSQLAGTDFPDYKEALARRANLHAELAPLTTEQLLGEAQKNPRLSECTLQLSSEGKKQFSIGRIKGAYSHSLEEPISLLEILGLINTVADDPESGRKAAYDRPEPSLLKNNMSDIGFYARTIIDVSEWGLGSAIDQNLIERAELRKGSATVMFRGEPVQYKLGTVIRAVSKDTKPFSQFVAPSERADLLFNDATINGMGTEARESSQSFSTRSAADFKIGHSPREQRISQLVSRCMQNLRVQGDHPEKQVATYFDDKCRESSDEVAIFIPADFIKLPKENWADMRLENFRLKHVPSGVTLISHYGSPNDGLETKECLRLSGHRTDLDYIASGYLITGNKAAFERAAKAAGIQGRVAQLAHEFAVLGTTKIPANQQDLVLKRFFRKGGFELFMSAISADGDFAKVSFGQNTSSGAVEMVSVASADATVEETIASSSQVSDEERAQLLKAQPQVTSCAMQTAFMVQMLTLSTQVDHAQSKAESVAAIHRAMEIVNHASKTMENSCRDKIVTALKTALQAAGG